MESLTDDEDFLELINIVDSAGKRKTIRTRPNHFEIWNDNDFVTRFRITKEAALLIFNEISDKISSKTQRNNAVSPMTMLLLTLRFFASGSMLVAVGDFCGIDKSTASRIIYKVTQAIANLRRKYIKFPKSTEDMVRVRTDFYRICRFPNCIGAVDCTHIKIQSPGGDDAEIFRNRKGFFSFNVQVICDAHLRILNVVARWPGSSHDSTIFKNSKICAKFENNEFENSVIVGDSGYGIKSYLITPLGNPRTPAEILFNEAQIRTRNPIERCFGVWKRRFPILSLGIRLHKEKIQAIVIATAVLHNIACNMNLKDPTVDQHVEDAIAYANIPQDPNRVDIGRNDNRIRYGLINDYFNSLL